MQAGHVAPRMAASPSRHARRPPRAVATGAVTPNHRLFLATAGAPTPRSRFPPRHAHAGALHGRGGRRASRPRRARGQNGIASRRTARGTGGTGYAHHARDRDTARRERDGNVRALARWGRGRPACSGVWVAGPRWQGGEGPRAWCARTAGRGAGGPSGPRPARELWLPPSPNATRTPFLTPGRVLDGGDETELDYG
ncbi:unnamed protein product [Urochloa humidicola]